MLGKEKREKQTDKIYRRIYSMIPLYKVQNPKVSHMLFRNTYVA